MRQPGLYSTWNQRGQSVEKYLVDYAARDEFDQIDFIGAIDVTGRSWRRLHVFGWLLAVSWRSCSSKT